MKFRDLRIGTQLRLGLGTILLLVLVLGVLAAVQTKQLREQAVGLYDHPLQVSQALGRLEVDVECMSRHVRDLFLADHEAETVAVLQRIEVSNADADRQLAILDERYLGPRDDLAALRDDLLKCHVQRDETVRLLRAGELDEAEARIMQLEPTVEAQAGLVLLDPSLFDRRHRLFLCLACLSRHQTRPRAAAKPANSAAIPATTEPMT